jgi:hypothetical protein
LFEEARKFVHTLGLKSEKEWRIYYRSEKKPIDIPAIARRTYEREWEGTGDWLGTGYYNTL